MKVRLNHWNSGITGDILFMINELNLNLTNTKFNCRKMVLSGLCYMFLKFGYEVLNTWVQRKILISRYFCFISILQFKVNRGLTNIFNLSVQFLSPVFAQVCALPAQVYACSNTGTCMHACIYITPRLLLESSSHSPPFKLRSCLSTESRAHQHRVGSLLPGSPLTAPQMLPYLRLGDLTSRPRTCVIMMKLW